MKFLTEDATVVCLHQGIVKIPPSQSLVTVNGRRVLVETDPEGKDIDRCPNRGPTIKKCGHSLKVAVGYSGFIRVDSQRVCLSNLTGLTDGTPPGTVAYVVRQPGQDLVSGAM